MRVTPPNPKTAEHLKIDKMRADTSYILACGDWKQHPLPMKMQAWASGQSTGKLTAGELTVVEDDYFNTRHQYSSVMEMVKIWGVSNPEGK